MSKIEVRCPKCGSQIMIDTNSDAGICDYCGAPYATASLIKKAGFKRIDEEEQKPSNETQRVVVQVETVSGESKKSESDRQAGQSKGKSSQEIEVTPEMVKAVQKKQQKDKEIESNVKNKIFYIVLLSLCIVYYLYCVISAIIDMGQSTASSSGVQFLGLDTTILETTIIGFVLIAISVIEIIICVKVQRLKFWQVVIMTAVNPFMWVLIILYVVGTLFLDGWF